MTLSGEVNTIRSVNPASVRVPGLDLVQIFEEIRIIKEWQTATMNSLLEVQAQFDRLRVSMPHDDVDNESDVMPLEDTLNNDNLDVEVGHTAEPPVDRPFSLARLNGKAPMSEDRADAYIIAHTSALVLKGQYTFTESSSYRSITSSMRPNQKDWECYLNWRVERGELLAYDVRDEPRRYKRAE